MVFHFLFLDKRNGGSALVFVVGVATEWIKGFSHIKKHETLSFSWPFSETQKHTSYVPVSHLEQKRFCFIQHLMVHQILMIVIVIVIPTTLLLLLL